MVFELWIHLPQFIDVVTWSFLILEIITTLDVLLMITMGDNTVLIIVDIFHNMWLGRQ